MGLKFVAVFLKGNAYQLASCPHSGLCEEMLQTALHGKFVLYALIALIPPAIFGLLLYMARR